MGLGSHNCVLLNQGAIKSDWHRSSCDIGGTAYAVDEARSTTLHSSLFSLSTDVSIQLAAFLACNNLCKHTQDSIDKELWCDRRPGTILKALTPTLSAYELTYPSIIWNGMGNQRDECVLIYQLRNELVHDKLFVQNVSPHHLPKVYGVLFAIRAHCKRFEPIQTIFSGHRVAPM